MLRDPDEREENDGLDDDEEGGGPRDLPSYADPSDDGDEGADDGAEGNDHVDPVVVGAPWG